MTSHAADGSQVSETAGVSAQVQPQQPTTPATSLLQAAVSAVSSQLTDPALGSGVLNPEAAAFVQPVEQEGTDAAEVEAQQEMAPLNGERNLAVDTALASGNQAESTPLVNGQAEAAAKDEPPAAAPVDLSLIRMQIEYYFSKANLTGDHYLKSQMDKDGFVPLRVLATFKQVKKYTQNSALLADAVRESKTVELCDQRQAVRQMQTRRTLILRDIPTEVQEQDLRGLFDGSGELPQCINTERVNESLWYVTFRREADATDAFNFLNQNRVQLASEEPINIRSCLKSDPISRAGVPNGSAPMTPQPSPQQSATAPVQSYHVTPTAAVIPPSYQNLYATQGSAASLPNNLIMPLAQTPLVHSTASQQQQQRLPGPSSVAALQTGAAQTAAPPLISPAWTNQLQYSGQIMWPTQYHHVGFDMMWPSQPPPPSLTLQQQNKSGSAAGASAGAQQSVHGAPRHPVQPQFSQYRVRPPQHASHSGGLRTHERPEQRSAAPLSYSQRSASSYARGAGAREGYKPPPRIERQQREREESQLAAVAVTVSSAPPPVPSSQPPPLNAASASAVVSAVPCSAPLEAANGARAEDFSQPELREHSRGNNSRFKQRRRRDDESRPARPEATARGTSGRGSRGVHDGFELDNNSFPALSSADGSAVTTCSSEAAVAGKSRMSDVVRSSWPAPLATQAARVCASHVSTLPQPASVPQAAAPQHPAELQTQNPSAVEPTCSDSEATSTEPTATANSSSGSSSAQTTPVCSNAGQPATVVSRSSPPASGAEKCSTTRTATSAVETSIAVNTVTSSVPTTKVSSSGAKISYAAMVQKQQPVPTRADEPAAAPAATPPPVPAAAAAPPPAEKEKEAPLEHVPNGDAPAAASRWTSREQRPREYTPRMRGGARGRGRGSFRPVQRGRGYSWRGGHDYRSPSHGATSHGSATAQSN